MKISLCNEVLAPWSLPEQCAYAKSVGYDGLEIAPFTLSDRPHEITDNEALRLRAIVEDHGLVVTSLHWLLLKPDGLSITSADEAVRRRTVEVMRRLTELCSLLGGKIMVHGSPHQRDIPAGESRATAEARAQACFNDVATTASACGVTYCIEPLAAVETPIINTVGDALRMIEAIGSPAIRTMVDCRAARLSEEEAVPELLDRWLPSGMIAHIQLNDRNGRHPGQGSDRFQPVLAALKRHHYDATVAIEPFEFVPDGPACAAQAIAYVRGVLETLG
jgi:sugar phosphate isomerase/epimerase